MDIVVNEKCRESVHCTKYIMMEMYNTDIPIVRRHTCKPTMIGHAKFIVMLSGKPSKIKQITHFLMLGRNSNIFNHVFKGTVSRSKCFLLRHWE